MKLVAFERGEEQFEWLRFRHGVDEFLSAPKAGANKSRDDSGEVDLNFAGDCLRYFVFLADKFNEICCVDGRM